MKTLLNVLLVGLGIHATGATPLQSQDAVLRQAISDLAAERPVTVSPGRLSFGEGVHALPLGLEPSDFRGTLPPPVLDDLPRGVSVCEGSPLIGVCARSGTDRVVALTSPRPWAEGGREIGVSQVVQLPEGGLGGAYYFLRYEKRDGSWVLEERYMHYTWHTAPKTPVQRLDGNVQCGARSLSRPVASAPRSPRRPPQASRARRSARRSVRGAGRCRSPASCAGR